MKINVFKDDQYSRNSADNKITYKHIFDDKSDYPTKIGILLKDNNETILDSAIILADGFSTGSWYFTEDILYVLAGKSLYRIKLPEFIILSISEADFNTTIELIKANNKLIVHGEQEISCFDLNGNKLWSFSGADIFVSINNKIPIEIFEDYIKLIDFEDREYYLNFDGKEINKP